MVLRLGRERERGMGYLLEPYRSPSRIVKARLKKVAPLALDDEMVRLEARMKALLKTKREVGIWMGEVPKPEVGPNDVLIRVHKSAICGTDVHIYNWDEWAQKTIPVPMVVGHEYVGVIEQVGAEVEGYQIGDRVSGEGHITCGHCRNCRAGKRTSAATPWAWG